MNENPTSNRGGSIFRGSGGYRSGFGKGRSQIQFADRTSGPLNINTQAIPTITEENSRDQSIQDKATVDAVFEADKQEKIEERKHRKTEDAQMQSPNFKKSKIPKSRPRTELLEKMMGKYLYFYEDVTDHIDWHDNDLQILQDSTKITRL